MEGRKEDKMKERGGKRNSINGKRNIAERSEKKEEGGRVKEEKKRRGARMKK